MKPLRVLVLMRPEFVPPESLEGLPDKEIHRIKTEFDVVSVLRYLGHEVLPLGVQHELLPIRQAVDEWHPDVAFNLLEEFHGEAAYDQNVVSYLELLRVPYTGCGPRGLVISRGKALSKKLLAYHRIRVPMFAVFPRRRRVRRPARLEFPLIVKSLNEHASIGIAQASLVDSDERLAERVAFVHERIGTDAIAEQYIDGRELYVAVLGNQRLQVLPTWELYFDNLPPNAPRIATERVKHDFVYQEERGINQGPAMDLPEDLETRIPLVAKRIYRILELDGYARIDFRLARGGRLYFLEANPNPEIAQGEEFAEAAAYAGIPYEKLLQRILALSLSRR
jgi:D-alanine-D-alanine ligase